MAEIKKVRMIAFMGLMLAIVIVLSTVEHMIPPLPFLPPNVKLGLSNIVTMYCLLFIGKKEAVTIAVLKSLFVFLIRGATAGILSLCGGLLSLFILVVMIYIFKEKVSYVVLSISGAIMHNMGQLLVVSFILGSNLIFWYMPVLLISGVVMGFITGVLLNVIMPVFKQVFRT